MPVAPFIPAIITAGATLGAGAMASNAAGKQAKAVTNAAKTAADAQLQTSQQQIDALHQGQAQAHGEIGPLINQQAENMWNASAGLNPTDGSSMAAARAQYDAGRAGSQFYQDAQGATARAISALQSSQLAEGKGGIRSGQATRAASDIFNTYASGITQNFNALLGGQVGTSQNARLALGNIDIGQAGGVASAIGQGGYGAAQTQLGGAVAGSNIQANNTNALLGLGAYGLGQILSTQSQPNAIYTPGPIITGNTPIPANPGVLSPMPTTLPPQTFGHI